MSLSVCMIVKNEEEVIERALNCVRSFADEIIVADTGSTDNTVELVKKYTNDLYFFKWCDDFSKARNFAISKATCDYVMWLDADDIVTEESANAIKKLVFQGGFDMAFLPYVATDECGAPLFRYNRERIFKRALNYRFEGFVHEAVAPRGEIVYCNAEIIHKKVKCGDLMRNLKIYQKAIAHGICLNEREKFYYGRELLFNKMYLESVAVLENFLSGNGWIENKIEACINLYSVYSILGDKHRAAEYLLRSFLYAPPRSQACCLLGDYFTDKNDFKSGIYWYERALNCDNGENDGAFVNVDYCAFIPLMQLCVLYDRLEDYQTANEYNERAGKIKPNNQNYLLNRQYFGGKLKK